MTSYSPQDLLDHLSSLDLPSLFAPELPTNEKQQSIKVIKPKLKLLKKEVKEEIDVIKSKWDGRNSYEALQERLHLAPYKMVENLVLQVEIALNELEIRGSVDWQPNYGSVIVGNLATEEWHIFKPKEATIWTAQNIQKEIKQLHVMVEQDKKEISSLNQHMKTSMRRQRIYGISCAVWATFVLLASLGFFTPIVSNLQIPLILIALSFYIGAIVLLWMSRKPSDELHEKVTQAQQHISQSHTLIEQRRKALAELKTLYESLKLQSMS